MGGPNSTFIILGLGLLALLSGCGQEKPSPRNIPGCLCRR